MLMDTKLKKIKNTEIPTILQKINTHTVNINQIFTLY